MLGIAYNTGSGSEDNLIKSDLASVAYSQPCLSHDDSAMRPLILTSYVSSISASQPNTRPGILVELREAQETIKIPGKFTRYFLVENVKS